MKKSKLTDKSSTSHECKNCSTAFKGNFCPECGQSVREFDKPINFLFVDLMGNMFAFDTRVWKSFKTLLTRPGKFTFDYLDGRRARYMPPFRLYVFISFIFFLILSFNLSKAIDLSDETKEKISSFNFVGGDREEDESQGIANTDSITDENNIHIYSSGISPIKAKQVATQFAANPDVYINSFLKFISWSMFLLMPLYAFILWWFFRKSKRYYYSHLILSINQHSFMFLMFILVFIVKLILPGRTFTPENYLLFLVPVYSCIGTYTFYKRKLFTSLMRTFTALVLYSFTLFIMILMLFGVWLRLELF